MKTLNGVCFAYQQFSSELLRLLSASPRPCMWSRLTFWW